MNKNTYKPSKERLAEILVYTKLNMAQLAKQIGYTSGAVFQGVKADKHSISSAVARKLVKLYPKLNYEYIIKGYGSLLRTDSEIEEVRHNEQAETNAIIEKLVAQNSELIKQLGEQMQITKTLLEKLN